MTVEEFAVRLNQSLLDKLGSSEYLHVTDLRESITEALSPKKINIEFPLALYRDREMRIVNSTDERVVAEHEGWGRTPPPQFALGFPQYFREKLTTEGGTRGFDIRKVMLHNEHEERLFRSVTEESEWTVDAGDRGGRGVGVADLVAEHRELLRLLIDREDFSAPAAQAPELPCDVTAELTTTTGANPDEVAPAQE
jgi:hypothetical protein